MPYSERIQPVGLTLHEALHGSLPSIDVLRVHFDDQLNEGMTYPHRIVKAALLAQSLKKQVGYDAQLGLDLKDPESDVLSLLFLDAIDYQVWNSILDNKKRVAGSVNGDLSSLYNKHSLARSELRNHIAEFEYIFKGAPSTTLYEALLAIMYDADCLVKNSRDVNSEAIRGSLSGILSEYKVLKATREMGWLAARYSYPFEDSFLKWDVVIPPHGIDRGYKAIQVKSNSNPDHKTQISVAAANLLEVAVPMHRSNDRFSLDQDDAQELAVAIRHAYPLW